MSRLRTAVLLGLCVAILLVGVWQAGAEAPAPPPSVEVHFSPRGGCQDAIVREIDAARQSVHVQAYSFTSVPIAKALVEAKNRGVKVAVVIDKSRVTATYSEGTFFANHGVPVFADGKEAIAHNKVMVIDGRTVITGSYNFTKAAEESNAENVLVIRLPDIVKKYEANFQKHLAHSVPYEKHAPQPAPTPKPEAGARVRPETKPAQDAANDPIVYVTRTGRKYHRAGCSYLRRSAIPKRLSEAKAAGYTPCSRCGPPQ